MKYALLIFLFAAVLPLSMWLRRDRRATAIALTLMGFLPFAQFPFHQFMAVTSWTGWSGYMPGVPGFDLPWPGYTQGLEVSTLDLLAVALYVSMPIRRYRLPFLISMALYFTAIVLSAFQAQVPMAAVFYLWQLARMFLVYVVVARACSDAHGPPALLTGMALGLFMEAGVEIWQRFGLGELQAHGTFAHQNLLGMMSHFVVLPFFAILLAGARGWLPAAVTLAGIPVQLLTTSRATVALAALAYAVVFIISVLRGWTVRKVQFLAIGVSAFMIAAPFALHSFDARFSIEASQYRGDDGRGVFEQVAAAILSDHPFGVGANHYALAANEGAYNQRLGVFPTPGNLLANVHNVYWLVAAESGYIGLAAFLLLLLRPLTAALLCGWRNQGDKRGDLLIGLGAALFTVYVHSLWEWVFVDFEVQYMFAMTVGLVAGLTQQLGYWRGGHARHIGFGLSPSPLGVTQRSSRSQLRGIAR